jgi:hypothetical protein
MHEPEFIRNKIIPYLKKEYGMRCFKIHGGAFQEAGIPDVIAVWEGKFISIEAKMGKNEPSPIQFSRLREIYSHGGYAGVIYDKNWQEDIEILLRDRYVNFLPIR